MISGAGSIQLYNVKGGGAREKKDGIRDGKRYSQKKKKQGRIQCYLSRVRVGRGCV